ncbi:MAG TPA: hypothetical protein VIL25_05740 [Vicinamibacterales bacterium]
MRQRKDRRDRTGVVASLLAPGLVATAFLYQALVHLQINIAQSETLAIVAAVLAVALGAGLLAAFGPRWLRLLVLSFTTVGLIDVALQPARLFDAMTPLRRRLSAQDARRIDDLHRINEQVQAYLRTAGTLPSARFYGEGAGPRGFWEGWWDLSTHDGDGDGVPFLDFLVERGLAESVPVDPSNTAPDPNDPRSGRQYVFFVVPPGYQYEGGVCSRWSGRAAYMIAVTKLDGGPLTSPERSDADDCACLWRNKPGFFSRYFDFALCGAF